jgi:hypothetical protein
VTRFCAIAFAIAQFISCGVSVYADEEVGVVAAAERAYGVFNRYRAMARETKDARGREAWEARQLLRRYVRSSTLFRTYARDYAEVLFPDDADVAAVRRMRTAILATVFGYDTDDWRTNFVDYVMAIAMAESKFDTRAVSWIGARGVMQIMPGTAKDVAENLSAARMRVIPSHADRMLSAQVMQGMEYLSWMISEAYVRFVADDLAVALRMNPAQTASLASKDAFFASYAYVKNGDTRRVRAFVEYLRSHICDRSAALRVCRIAAAMYNAGQYHAVIAQGDVPRNGQTDFYVPEVVVYWNRHGFDAAMQADILASVLRRKHETIVMRFAEAYDAWERAERAVRSALSHDAQKSFKERLARRFRLIEKDFPL